MGDYTCLPGDGFCPECGSTSNPAADGTACDSDAGTCQSGVCTDSASAGPTAVNCVETGNTATDCLASCALAPATVITQASGGGTACVGDYTCLPGDGFCPECGSASNLVANGTACNNGAGTCQSGACTDSASAGPTTAKNCKDDFDVSDCPTQFQAMAATVIRSNTNTLDNISCAGDTCLVSECCPECSDQPLDRSWYGYNTITYDRGPNDLRYQPVADGGCPITSGGVCKAVKCSRGPNGLEMPTCDPNEENKPDATPCTDGAISGSCYGGVCTNIQWIRGVSDETCTQTCSGATDLSGQPMTCQDGDWGVHDPVTMRRVLEQVENLPAGISSSCPLQGGSSDTQEGRRIRQSYSLTVRHGGYDMLELLPGIAVNSLSCLYDWDRPRTGRRGGVSSCDGSPQDIGAPHYNRLCKCV